MSIKANFRSDNEASVAPEIIAALQRANAGPAHAYGEDPISQRLTPLFRELFETELAVFPVATGTSANALSVAQLTPPYGAVYCHADAHLNNDECGAPEFYTGGAKLVTVQGDAAKIDPDALASTLARAGVHGDHECMPATLSLSQATEFGAVYSPLEIEVLTRLAREKNLFVHMDGARFANAVQSLACSPADLSWRAGVDMLSFGATKGGAMGAEAILVFQPQLADTLGRRRKRAGHLLSKMRYVSAQLEAYVTDGLWLRLAGRANQAAARVAESLSRAAGARLIYPVQANEIFVRLEDALAQALWAEGFEFHRWPGTRDIYRLVMSFDTPEAAVEAFVNAVARLSPPP